MLAIACPNCRSPMQVEESEANTEWECPTCAAAFVLGRDANGSLQYEITEEGEQPPEYPDISLPQPATPTVVQDPAIDEEAYVYALERLLKGTRPREVRKSLLKAGHSAKQADHILQVAIKFQKDSEAKEKMMPGSEGNTGNRNMAIGGAVCILGIVVTLGSMALANRPGGGTFILAWGAIIYGGIQFFRGWVQSRNS